MLKVCVAVYSKFCVYNQHSMSKKKKQTLWKYLLEIFSGRKKTKVLCVFNFVKGLKKSPT